MKSSQLLILQSESKAIKLSNFLKTIAKRHYNEFWTSGNDIAKEGAWTWAGDDRDRRVPEFGWSEQSFISVEENCLVWVVEIITMRLGEEVSHAKYFIQLMPDIFNNECLIVKLGSCSSLLKSPNSTLKVLIQIKRSRADIIIKAHPPPTG